MVTESMGPIYDRTEEHLGTIDRAIVRMRRLLLDAAQTVEAGGRAPAAGFEGDYRSIRAAEKILEVGEDWRILGTELDPLIKSTEHDLEVDEVEALPVS